MNDAGDRIVAGGPYYSGRGHARVYGESFDGAFFGLKLVVIIASLVL